MTADRDALAAIIGDVAWPSSWDKKTYRAIADAILAAGWRAPKPPRSRKPVSRCSDCGHADSRHNDLGSCQVGECMCR